MRNLNVDGRAKTLSQLSRNGILSSERRGAWEGEPCQQSRQKTFEFLAEWWRLTRLTGRVKEEATSLGLATISGLSIQAQPSQAEAPFLSGN